MCTQSSGLRGKLRPQGKMAGLPGTLQLTSAVTFFYPLLSRSFTQPQGPKDLALEQAGPPIQTWTSLCLFTQPVDLSLALLEKSGPSECLGHTLTHPFVHKRTLVSTMHWAVSPMLGNGEQVCVLMKLAFSGRREGWGATRDKPA